MNRFLPEGPARACVLATVSLCVVMVTAVDAQPPTPGPQPVLTLPRLDADAALDRYFQIDLVSGDVFLIDRVRRDPLSTRRARLRQNVIELIGRPPEPAPVVGEILLAPLHDADDSVNSAVLVETSTGYLAYFDDLGRGNKLGEIKSAIGRPFGDLVASDGNFALLTRRIGNGRTVDLILYHATTGNAQAVRDIEKLPLELEAVAIRGMPTLEGQVASVPLQRDGGGTDGYLIFDGGSGAIHRIGLSGQGLPAPAVEQPQNLFEVFPREATLAAAPRFVPVPILTAGQRTRHVLLIDAGSGGVAWLRDVDGYGEAPSLRALTGDLMRFLTADSPAPRSVAAVPRTGSSGETTGVWLTDGLTDRVLYLSSLDQPDALSVGVVTMQR